MNMTEAYLAIAFPPQMGFRGAATTIADLSKHGLYSGHLGITPDKFSAVRLMVTRNLRQQSSRGHGNKAMSRARRVFIPTP